MGKISKPQKSGKHKKIKFVDPFYHGERKERMHAGKNLAPVSTEQGISRSVRDLMRRTKETKELKNKSRKQTKEILKKRVLAQMSIDGAERAFTEVGHFKKRKGEKQKEFMQRIESATMVAIKEAQIEAGFKNKPDPVLDDNTQKGQRKKEKQKEKKQKKKEKKKQKAEDRKDDFEDYKDEVKFGEQVHGLPTLSVRPKHATASEKPAVESLLLYDVVKKNKGGRQADTLSSHPSSTANGRSKQLGRGQKRKTMSPAQQRQMDQERQNAIERYRKLKQATNRPG